MDKTRAQILGENLKRIRQLKGYSRKELADVIGITENSFGSYERGEKLPPLDKIFKLAEFLDISILDITGGTPNVERDIIFEYRYKRALKIATDARFIVNESDKKEISLTPPIDISTDTGLKISVTFNIGFAPVLIKNRADFVQIMEDTESLALFNDKPFKQIFIERFYKKK